MKKAFTIVELLVVIGVISILAGMLFPMLSKSRERALRSSCISNLRQIGTAISAYCSESGGCLPVCLRIPSGPGDPDAINAVIDLNTKNIYHCPSDTEEIYDGQSFFSRYGSSYEWNAWLNGKQIDKPKLGIAEILLSVPMMGDAMAFHKPKGRNYLYPDSSVKESLEVLIE